VWARGIMKRKRGELWLREKILEEEKRKNPRKKG